MVRNREMETKVCTSCYTRGICTHRLTLAVLKICSWTMSQFPCNGGELSNPPPRH